MLNDVFKKFGLRNVHTKTYLALLEGGPTSAGHLAKRVDMPRSTLYGLLDELSQKGLIKQGRRDGIKKWSAESPEKIKNILDNQVSSIEDTLSFFNTILPDLKNKERSDLSDPHFQFFEGREGVQHILNAPLFHRDLETEAIWPISEMLDVLGDDYHRQNNRERIKRNISIRAIWPEDKSLKELSDIIKKNPYLGVSRDFKREIRKGPKGLKCQMGYWAFKDKVGFVSSKNEGFGFIIQSADFRQLLNTQFENLWNQSTPIKVDGKHTNEFLESVKRYPQS